MSFLTNFKLLAIDLRSRLGAIAMMQTSSVEGTGCKRLAPQAERS